MIEPGQPESVATLAPHASRRGLWLQLALAAVLLIGDWSGILEGGGFFLIVAAAVWIAHRSGRGGRDLGLGRPGSWSRVVALGVGSGIGFQILSLYVIEPLLAEWTGQLPDLTLFRSLEGNVPLLVIWLVVAWVIAGLGEELVFRGFILDRFGRASGGSRGSWVGAALISSIVFGLGHLYQGWSGVLITGFSGLVFASLFLGTGRNLWAAVISHGTMDSMAFTMIFLGIYPGL